MESPRQKWVSLLRSQLNNFVLLAVLLGGGMGTVFVQTVGWVTMLPDQYQKTGSVTVAIENTFDGEHACEFCKAAERMRKAEIPHTKEGPQQRPKKPVKKLFCDSVSPIFVPKPFVNFLPFEGNQAPSYFELSIEPESPPPQLV